MSEIKHRTYADVCREAAALYVDRAADVNAHVFSRTHRSVAEAHATAAHLRHLAEQFSGVPQDILDRLTAPGAEHDIFVNAWARGLLRFLTSPLPEDR